MKTKLSLSARRRKAKAQLDALGNLLEGSLCRVERGNAVRFQLTDKAAGRSRTLYVPAEMAGEVRQWTQNWKQAKRLLRELSELSREEVRAGARDGGRRKPPTPR
ncbi:MAG: hypothetical protein GX608_03290 [Lentisphaerae bacterium]|jgi:hypothetical protein|nr:hypothetical protein [Lentisphaerota bacterium]